MKKLLVLALLLASTSLHASDFGTGRFGVGGLYNSFNGVNGPDGGALSAGYYTNMFDVTAILSNRTIAGTSGTTYGFQGKIKTSLGNDNFMTAGASYRGGTYGSASPSMYGVSVGFQHIAGDKLLLEADIFPYYASTNAYGSATVASTSQIFEVVQVGVSYLF